MTDELPDPEVLGPETFGVERIDLTAALARLSKRQRLAVALHYYLSLTVQDCSEVMGCSTGTVKSTLFDARQRLREILGGAYR